MAVVSIRHSKCPIFEGRIIEECRYSTRSHRCRLMSDLKEPAVSGSEPGEVIFSATVWFRDVQRPSRRQVVIRRRQPPVSPGYTTGSRDS